MATTTKSAVQIGKLLKDIDTAMLTTVGPDGYLVSRPLSTQKTSFDGRRVWFFTEADSPKVAEIRRNPKVNLAYASEGKNTYVSVAGDARISRDQAQIDELWSDPLKAFFPGGKDDPNLVLLEITVRTVEYWDGPGTLLGKVVSFVIARVTKNEEVMSENRLMDLTGKRTTTRLPPSHKDAKPDARAAAKKSVKKSASKPASKAAGRKSTQTVAKKTAPSPTSPGTSKAKKAAPKRSK